MARHRLEVLYADTQPGGSRDIAIHRPSPRTYDQFRDDRNALRAVLDELHRLHLAVSEQGRTLVKLLCAKKQPHRKPAAAQSRHATAHKPSQKGSAAAALWILCAAFLAMGLTVLAVPQGDKPTLVSDISKDAAGIATPLGVDANGTLVLNFTPNSLSFQPGSLRIAGNAVAPLWTTESGEFTHIAGTTAVAVRNNGGQLKSIIIGTPAAGTVSVFDLASASCTGTPSTNVVSVITVTSSTPPQAIAINAHLHNGICVQASATMDLTVVRQ
jgi:hypothetical protein